MRVGVIAAEMEGSPTGVGRYLAGMLRGLECWAHGSEWSLFFAGRPFAHPLFEAPHVTPHFSGFTGHRVLWEQAVMPLELRHDDLDLLYCPAYTVPFGVRIPTVVTLHDLSFERFPADFSWRERWRRRLLARRAARVARRVLVDSAPMAREVASRYGVEEQRLGVVPAGVGRELMPAAGDATQRVAALDVSGPYLLSVGSILERRQPRLVLESFAVLAAEHPDLRLVVVGDNRLRRPERLRAWIAELGIGARVRLLGFVDDGVLAALYRGAELTVYLSSYEGFGMPPLESLAFGTPALVGPGLALDELWPDYPLRVPELTTGAVVEVAGRFLADPAAAAPAFQERAGEVLAGLSWEASSRRLVAELERALGP